MKYDSKTEEALGHNEIFQTSEVCTENSAIPSHDEFTKFAGSE